MSLLEMREITLKAKRGPDAVFKGRLLGVAGYRSLLDMFVTLLEGVHCDRFSRVIEIYQTEGGARVEYQKGLHDVAGTWKRIGAGRQWFLMRGRMTRKVEPEVVR